MSRSSLLLLTLVGALFALSPRAALAQNPPAVPIQLVKVNGPAANLCLQTSRVPGDVQNRLVPATCMDIGGLQMFSFQPVQGGGYRIVNTETFHCLDVEWGANWGGGRVLDWPCNNQDNQRWEVTHYGGWMKARGWQSKLCLDVANGIAIQTDCAGWGIDAYKTGPAWRTYRQGARTPFEPFGMRSAQSGLCMTTDYAPVLGACRGPTHNDLEIETIESNGATFRFTKAGNNCLVDTGTFAMYGTCAGQSAWRLVQVSPTWPDIPNGAAASRWQIQNVGTGRCLADSTSLLLMAVCSGTAATTWSPVNTLD